MAKARQVAAESVAAFNAHDMEWLRSLYARDQLGLPRELAVSA